MEKNLSFFSFIYELNSKKRTHNKPNTVQTLHLPPNDKKTLLLKTENHETLFAEMPPIHSLSKLKRDFPFMEFFIGISYFTHRNLKMCALY